MRRTFSTVMASVQNIGNNAERNKVDNARTHHATVKETSPLPMNRAPGKESYWFAYGRTEDVSPGNTQTDPKSTAEQKDREEKMRMFREQQEEERLKKLRGLEQQFLLAKKHREQLEEERRHRIEEARLRESERRHQVEERKRQIWEAEQERKEAILRRNMEREARIEARRNAQRNSQSFAFGSSTPRTFDLDLAAIGLHSNTVLMSSVGRRSEERDLGPPRATSACSLDRKFGEDCMSRSMVSLSSSSSTFRGRRRTDITPTLSRERSITPHVTPRGKDSSRSPPRPQSSMSGVSDISATTSSSVSAVNMRPRPAPRRPRPYSVIGSITQPTKKEPDRQPRGQDRAAPTPRAKSACREVEEQKRPLTAPKKPLPPPKSSELLAKAKSHPVPTKDNLRKMNKPTTKPMDKTSAEKKDKSNEEQTVTDKIECKRKEPPPPPEEETQLNSAVTSPTTDSEILLVSSDDSKTVPTSELSQSVTEIPAEEPPVKEVVKAAIEQSIPSETPEKDLGAAPPKPRISSEEEARAALAEKRRLAREQAEREAELERQRLEEIKRQEEEQREREEQEQRRMEEEQIRLAELHRRMEQEKLAKAIEEQKQREKEEQERREEETRQRLEKEEQEKKAREEAERQRLELEEKLRKEEEERAERKRRVEQIMARTRGKTAAQSPSGTPGDSKVTPTTPRGTDIPNGTTDTEAWLEQKPLPTTDSEAWLEQKPLPTTESEAWLEQKPLPDILNAAIHTAKRNVAFVESNHANSHRTLSANEDVSPQSNGYSSHEDMSCTTSPEESSEVGLLIDIQQQRSSTESNVNNENFLINVDDVNSNLFGNPFVDAMQKKQDTQVTDLLS